MKKLLERRLVDAGYLLSEQQIELLALFMSELKKWNNTVNLTAIGSDEAVISKHLIDSLSLLSHLEQGQSLLDVGSGAGFPAIPLKIVRTDCAITTVDAVRKKIMFQKHAARVLKLENFFPVHSRVEMLYEAYHGQFDIIVSRAFTRLDHFIQLVMPLLKPGGRMIAMKGPSAEEEMKKGEKLLKALGVSISAIESYQLPENYGNRQLVTLTCC